MREVKKVENKNYERLSGAKMWQSIDDGALICDCNSDRFYVIQPKNNRNTETIVRCTWCGLEEIVHET